MPLFFSITVSNSYCLPVCGASEGNAETCHFLTGAANPRASLQAKLSGDRVSHKCLTCADAHCDLSNRSLFKGVANFTGNGAFFKNHFLKKLLPKMPLP